MAKFSAKYAMTALTKIVVEPGEVLSEEDFVGRLVDLGMEEEAAKASFSRAVKDGVLFEVEGGEAEESSEAAEAPPAEPEGEAPAEPADESPAASEPAEEAPKTTAKKGRGRPKKKTE